MVIAYHLIGTLYGRWLPNGPRGSMSGDIRVERIAELGNPVKIGRPVQEWPFVTTYDGWLPRPARET